MFSNYVIQNLAIFYPPSSALALFTTLVIFFSDKPFILLNKEMDGDMGNKFFLGVNGAFHLESGPKQSHDIWVCLNNVCEYEWKYDILKQVSLMGKS